MKTSITEDFDMTCDELYLRSIFNSLFLGGMLLGSFSFGMISDKFGRVNAMVLSIFLTASSGLAGENSYLTEQRFGSIFQNGSNPNAIFQLSVAYLGPLATLTQGGAS